jgi:hypothetical protein
LWYIYKKEYAMSDNISATNSALGLVQSMPVDRPVAPAPPPPETQAPVRIDLPDYEGTQVDVRI